MNITKLLVSLITITLGAYQAFGQETVTRGRYSLVRSVTTNATIESIDFHSVVTNHISNYGVQRDKHDKGSGHKVETTATLYPTVAQAETGVLDLLNSVSAVYTNGSPSGVGIGDMVWHIKTKSTGAVTITFIRKNIVVSVFSNDPAVAETLAEKIDKDIVAGGAAVRLKQAK
jgi:hypothetical protein